MTCLFQCDGGWLAVNDEYIAAQLAKLPERMDPDVRSDMRASIRSCVYPCPSCRPAQHELWRGGHFHPDHTCEECVARRSKRGRAKVSA